MTVNKTAQNFRNEIAYQIVHRPWSGQFELQTLHYAFELLEQVAKKTDLQSVRSFSEFETICLAGAPDLNMKSHSDSFLIFAAIKRQSRRTVRRTGWQCRQKFCRWRAAVCGMP